MDEGKIILTFSINEEGEEKLTTQPQGIRKEDRESLARRFLEYCRMTLDFPVNAFIATGMHRKEVEGLGFKTTTKVTWEDKEGDFIQRWTKEGEKEI